MPFDFDRVRADQLKRYDSRHPLLAARLRGEDVLYLFGTLCYEAVLRRSGEVWAHIDDDHASQPGGWRPASEAERLEALALGAQEMPELTDLLPRRPAVGVEDCPACGGARLIQRLVCCPTCGGLGWRDVAAT